MDAKVSKQDKFVNAMPVISLVILVVVGLVTVFVM